MKIGILGAGAMGNAHITGFRSLKDQNATYVSVFDIDEKKRNDFGQKFGLDTYPDLDSMLNDKELDIIDLCLPSFMHEEFAVKIAKAGKHMLIEKPIAFTLPAAKNIFIAAHQNNVRIMVAQVIRFWPEYVKIKEMCDQGDIGNIISVYAARLSQLANWSDWYKYPDKSGEALMNLTLHDIDFLHYLLGKPESVYSAGKKDENGNYNDVMNLFRFKSGANALVDGSSNMTPGYPFTMRMRVLGTKGTLEFAFISGENIGPESTSSLMWYQQGKSGVKIKVENNDPYGREVQYFVNCIKNNEETAVVSEQSIMEVMASLMAAKESLVTGKVYNL
ncbi:MAG: Gfo/Idh/MocA family oxidoreductase [Bacteroidales bacterium]|jgi:predicted dehydrogenase|nr:Gfo/Idh/MocA family oxidoreductase [Bacteroidales bacterium]